MGQSIGLKNIVILSAIASFIFGGGYLINEAEAGAPLPTTCLGFDGTIFGTPGDDEIKGARGNDVIITYGGNDEISSGNGDDVICSGEGKDEIKAGRGNDIIDPGPGSDDVNAGQGDDQVFARDGNFKDKIQCGKGNDFAQVDETEKKIKSCETVEFPYEIANGNGDANDNGDDDNGDDDNGDDKKERRDKIKKSISKFFKRHR